MLPSHRTRRVLVTTAAAAAALVVAACGGDGEADADSEPDAAETVAADPVPLDIYIGTDPVFGVVYYAQEAGLFEEEGVDATINLFPSGTEAFESYRSAGAGLVAAGDLPSLRAWLVGDTVGISPLSFDTKTFSVAAGPGIDEPADLAGGRMATVVGSSGSYYVHNYLVEYDLLDKVEVINLSPGDMAPALARGDIEAFVWNTATLNAALEATPGATLLQEGSEGFLVNRIIINAASSTIADEPDTVQAAVRAITRACEAMSTDDNADAVVAEFLGIEADKVATDSDGVTFDCGFDENFVADMTKEAEISFEIGLTDGELDWSSMFDTSFLEAVDESLVTGEPPA